MNNDDFEFGPLSRGTYIALIALTALVPQLAPHYFLHYIALLLFLGVGLRFCLIRSGLYHYWGSLETAVIGRWDKKYLAKRTAEIERKQRDEIYRKSHVRDPKLPKNW